MINKENKEILQNHFIFSSFDENCHRLTHKGSYAIKRNPLNQSYFLCYNTEATITVTRRFI